VARERQPLGTALRHEVGGPDPNEETVLPEDAGVAGRSRTPLGCTMNDRIANELQALRTEIAALARRIDAVQADVETIARTASRFGRDIELRERGWV
jgi:hypothetical protein